MRAEADAVVCGAGIAGISCAFHLARAGCHNIAIVDPRAPMSLTSDKSTECYRNWWPSPSMVALMDRSIEILESLTAESGDAFRLNRRGYLYVTAREGGVETFEASGQKISQLGAGDLRVHRRAGEYEPAEPSDAHLRGADLLAGPKLVVSAFPWLTPRATAALHVRRAGWVSAQQLGAWMLEDLRSRGTRLFSSAVAGIGTKAARVSSVHLEDGQEIETEVFVNAAGPMLGQVAQLVEVSLPLTFEVHHKVAFKDSRGAFPRSAPMTIWADPQQISWSADERAGLTGIGREDLLGPMPPACHGRPEGSGASTWVLALWEYRKLEHGPTFPLPRDPLYPEVVMRGMSTMVPGLGAYLDHMPQPVVDGGLYTKLADNLPLVGPSGPAGSFVCGALSGFGVMAAAGVGELLAAHVTGGTLPDYAAAFLIDRLERPIVEPEDDGQL